MRITKTQIPPGSRIQGGKSKAESLEDMFVSRWANYLNHRLDGSIFYRYYPARQVQLIFDRKLCWDFVWFHKMVCVEINGGQYMPVSGHTSISGTNRDAEKSRIAAALGYRTLYFTGDDVKQGRGFAELASALGIV